MRWGKRTRGEQEREQTIPISILLRKSSLSIETSVRQLRRQRVADRCGRGAEYIMTIHSHTEIIFRCLAGA